MRGSAFDGDGKAIRDNEEAMRWRRRNGWFDHGEFRDFRGDNDYCDCSNICGIMIVVSPLEKKYGIEGMLRIVGKQMS